MVTETKSPLERRIENINFRREATQEINPITSRSYEPLTYKVRWYEDPLQAHLKAMEKRELSQNEHKQDAIKTVEDFTALKIRAARYFNEDILIVRTNTRGKKQYENYLELIDLSKYHLEIKTLNPKPNSTLLLEKYLPQINFSKI